MRNIQKTSPEVKTLFDQLNDAASVAHSEGWPHCGDQDEHDALECSWCAFKKARDEYRAAKRGAVIARLAKIETFEFEIDTPARPLVETRRRRRERARLAYIAADANGTAAEVIDAAVALELAECEHDIIFRKALHTYNEGQCREEREALWRRHEEGEHYAADDWRIFKSVRDGEWWRHCRNYVMRYGSNEAKTAFDLISLRVVKLPIGYKAPQYLEWLERTVPHEHNSKA